MEELLGFKIDFCAYVTFAALSACVVIGLSFVVSIAGLPGKSRFPAISRMPKLRRKIASSASKSAPAWLPANYAIFSSPTTSPCIPTLGGNLS